MEKGSYKITNANRIQYIDIAKGIAIICIILGHLGINSINRVVFTFHVPIFYFITGYFTNEKRSIREFLKNKANSLLVPYLITCAVIVILGTIKGALSGNAMGDFKMWCYAGIYGAGDSYTEPFYIKGIGAIWFLLATFWGSLLLRISLGFSKYLRMLFIAVLFAFGFFSKLLFWFPFSIQAGACAAMFMYLGYIWHETREKIKGFPLTLKIAGAIAALAVWLLFVWNFKSFWLVHCDFGRGFVDILGCVCACICVFLISRFIELKVGVLNRVLALLGRISLLILCIHVVELNLFPWGKLAECIEQIGVPKSFDLPIVIVGKLLVDLGGAVILSRITLIRKLFHISK